MSGYVKWCTNDFINIRPIIILFNAYVRSIFGYSSVICTHYCHIHSKSIEKVHNFSVVIRCITTYLNCSKPVYIIYFRICSIEVRRAHYNFINIANNLTDSKYFLNENFATSVCNTKSLRLFACGNHKKLCYFLLFR